MVSGKGYALVFATLLALTLLTVAVSRLDLGPFNTPLALAIAVSKALFVLLFFMHLRSSAAVIWLVVVGGLLWFGILLALTLSDYLTRGSLV